MNPESGRLTLERFQGLHGAEFFDDSGEHT
jgi:hypothetical protein